MNSATVPSMPVDVAETFDTYPPAIRAKLVAVRQLIFEVAEAIEDVGPLEETLKSGEPAYLPAARRTGSAVRLGFKRSAPERYGVYFHCKTTLVGTFRTLFADEFAFEGNRALLLKASEPLPEKSLATCVAMALTYHRAKRRT